MVRKREACFFWRSSFPDSERRAVRDRGRLFGGIMLVMARMRVFQDGADFMGRARVGNCPRLGCEPENWLNTLARGRAGFVCGPFGHEGKKAVRAAVGFEEVKKQQGSQGDPG